mmetsp:Transcript_47059/g.102410  ORF Transcript_47059/g.102410 Transcript_47059/m.102410 type:complete len:116 (+) Transcript_47059:82-429(+)
MLRRCLTALPASRSPLSAFPRSGLLGPSLARYFAEKSGTVKFFNAEKGFGFIESEGQDYFIHYTNIESSGFRSLADGEEVEFDLEMDEKKGKQMAVRVTGPGGAQVKGSQRQDQY